MEIISLSPGLYAFLPLILYVFFPHSLLLRSPSLYSYLMFSWPVVELTHGFGLAPTPTSCLRGS